MLQVIRDRAQGFFAWLVVGAIIISFALFGLNAYFDETGDGFQAALVNDEKVAVYEYQVAYQNERSRMQQMFGANFDPDMFDNQIKNSALERVIENEVLIQNARNTGMYISDAQLANQIQTTFVEDGIFSKALYEQQLGQAGESTAGYEYRVRRGMMANQMVNGITQTNFATNEEVDLTIRLREQKREFAYVTVPTSKYKESIEISDEESKAYYESNKGDFKTEEQVKLNYLELSVDTLLDTVEIEQDELEDFYEDQKSRFTTEEQRRARHILFEFGDDSDTAKTKAEAVYDKAIAGESFETLAKENSEDIGSAAEGGDLGFFGKGDMDESFEDAVFELTAGQISKPIRSAFGYHVIKLEEIKAGEGKAFGEVKEEIESELRKQKAEKLYFDKVEQLANLAYETPDTLEVAKEELGLKVKTSPFVSKRGGPGVFGNRKVIDAAFSDDVLKENLNSEAIEISSSQSIVVRLSEFKESETKPFEQVKAQIINQLSQEKALEKAKAVAKAIEEKILAGTSGEDAVKEDELTWNAKKWVDRKDSDISREIIQAAFSIPRSEDEKLQTKGIALNNKDYVLVALSSIKDGDQSGLSEQEVGEIRKGISDAVAYDSFTSFLKSVKDKSEIEKFPANL